MLSLLSQLFSDSLPVVEAQHLVSITSQASPPWMVPVKGAPIQPILVQLFCAALTLLKNI